MHKIIRLQLILIFVCNIGFTQILVEADKTPEQLIAEVLLGRNSGLKVDSVRYIGDKRALAIFHTESKYMPIQSGIILSTGLAEDADGPNESDNKGTMLSSLGDVCFQKIADGLTKNAAILSFVFYPSTDSITFDYVFASEEYPEFVNCGVNDLFAFFISGPGYSEPENIALIPGTNIPVAVDNINVQTHSEFFLENRKWNATNRLWFANNLAQGERSYNCEYDGMTVCLKAKAKVVPFEPYLLKLAIADVGDAYYDSGVFIKKQSLKSSGGKSPVLELAKNELEHIVDSIKQFQVISESNHIRIIPNALFAFNSFAIEADYEVVLHAVIKMLQKYFTLKVRINGYTDNVGSDDYNLELSEKRAVSVSKFLIVSGIASDRIDQQGKGKIETPSKTDNLQQKALNRRVEIVLY